MLSRLEIVKDTLQTAIESGAPRVGRIATLIANTVRDITRELGEWATDVFDAAEAARRAEQDRRRRTQPGARRARTTSTARRSRDATTH